MKVILLQDIPSVGKKYDIKEVNGGYARNFLLPRGLVKPATDAAIADLAARKERDERKKTDERRGLQAAVARLKNVTLSFRVKIGEKGKAFGSITAQKIADALNRQGIAAEKEWILLEEQIKTTGEKIVPIHFPHGVSGEIKLIVEAE